MNGSANLFFLNRAGEILICDRDFPGLYSESLLALGAYGLDVEPDNLCPVKRFPGIFDALYLIVGAIFAQQERECRHPFRFVQAAVGGTLKHHALVSRRELGRLYLRASYNTEGHLRTSVDAVQFASFGRAMDVDGVPSVPYVAERDAVSSVSVFGAHGKNAIFAFPQYLERPFFFQGPVLSADV